MHGIVTGIVGFGLTTALFGALIKVPIVPIIVGLLGGVFIGL